MDPSTQTLSARNGATLLTAGSLLGLTAGIVLGVVAYETKNPVILGTVSVVEPLGVLWTNALLMVILPLVVSFLIIGIAGVSETQQSGRLGTLTLGFVVALLTAAAAFTLLLGPPLLGLLTFEAPALSPVTADPALVDSLATGGSAPSFGEWILGLVPPNPVRAAAEGEILPVMVFTVLSGLAITRIPAASRQLLVSFFRAVADATMVLVGWLLKVIPLAVFAISFPMAARTGLALAGAVGWFIVLVCGFLLAFTLLLYPVTAALGGIPVRRFARGVAASQAVAVGTRSSLATLPALMEGARDRLEIPASAAGVVLPLTVSAFKLNRTISGPLKLLFLASLYGVSLEPGYVVIFTATTMLLSFSSPGIPSGGFMVTLPFYLAAGLPVEGVVLLKAVDAIPDIFKTLLNVTADMSVAVMTARFVRAPSERAEAALHPHSRGPSPTGASEAQPLQP
jgi:Na+/H+-dicarboxylate symporter